MLELVTLQEAYAQLRIDDVDSSGSPDDPWLQMAIPAVSEAVAGWLKDSWRLYEPELDSVGDVVIDSDGDPVPAEDSSGDKIIRQSVKLAVLIELASQYRFREGEGDNLVDASAGHGYTLSRGAVSILTPLRKPTVA
jgi:hypothetical protein